MRKPTVTKATLAETTALTPPVPSIGDNSAAAGQSLPTAAVTHAEIEATLVSIMDNERAIDYARQKLARLFEDRHDQLVAADTNNSVPFAHQLATSSELFDAYLTKLAAEFTLSDPAKLATMDTRSRDQYTKRIRAKCMRALLLFAYVSWFKLNNPGEHVRWNADIGRWELSPFAFLPPDHVGGGHLILEQDGKTPRKFIVLESIEATEYYFVQRGKSANVSINVSLDQLEYAISQQIARSRNPHSPTPEATAPRQTRAARQAAAKADAAAQAAAAQADVDATDSDAPEADALSGDRAHALGQLTKMLVSLSKWINHDTLANLSWSDLSRDAVNALTEVEMLVTRMNAKPDGKVKSKPVKLAA